MKKIGFIGAYDKTDMIVYIGKILTVLKQKVLKQICMQFFLRFQ